MIQQWRNEQKTGRKGASDYYRDERNHDNGDTQNGVWVSFKTEGFLESLFTLIGIDERSARSHYALRGDWGSWSC